jgi:hypothetical protein
MPGILIIHDFFFNSNEYHEYLIVFRENGCLTMSVF